MLSTNAKISLPTYAYVSCKQIKKNKLLGKKGKQIYLFTAAENIFHFSG